MRVTKLAIIGASYLQLPLIEKAKSMGIETHVFAWAANDVGETAADYFYPISIVEKELILEQCVKLGINGICSIASDLAMVTVNYVAARMGLIGNSLDCTQKSTNKHLMRLAFEQNGDPSPKSLQVEGTGDLKDVHLCYPVIVKPVDRSGSRGITKLETESGLAEAIENAKTQGFEKTALVEEYAEGREYSVECISWEGKHHFLAMTQKYTTGAPGFVETGHLEPAPISELLLNRVKEIVFHALDSLGICYGASHSELKIDDSGRVVLIEIGGRMGGDLIGSDLVPLSTGVDYVKAVIDVALGKKPDVYAQERKAAAVRFVFAQEDIDILNDIKRNHPQILQKESVTSLFDHSVTDSSNRFGYYLLSSDNVSLLRHYMPVNK